MSLGFVFVCILFIRCGQDEKKSTEEDTGETSLILLEADRAFSKSSQDHGMKKAYIEYLDVEGVLIREKHSPLKGAAAIEYLSNLEDTSYTITWDPQQAETARSGELGYTYGILKIWLKDMDSLMMGSYNRVWRKTEKGEWKLLQDVHCYGIE
jgi:ketosteroid isomerase-like protein